MIHFSSQDFFSNMHLQYRGSTSPERASATRIVTMHSASIDDVFTNTTSWLFSRQHSTRRVFSFDTPTLFDVHSWCSIYVENLIAWKIPLTSVALQLKPVGGFSFSSHITGGQDAHKTISHLESSHDPKLHKEGWNQHGSLSTWERYGPANRLLHRSRARLDLKQPIHL